MTELLSGVETPSDAELISRVRGGDAAAYGELFSRHVDAARRLGRQLVRGPDADDLVSEAFAKTLQVLQGGGGPDVAFRAYLLTSVRRLHVDKIRAAKKVQPSDDMSMYDDGMPFQDTVVADFESGAAAKAFSSLPERWQLVLWHLEVEGQKPADIAPLLGMSANSVSALAYRAREGLRQAFLTMHLADCATEQCRWVNQHLGAYVRKGLSRRDTAKVQEHLEGCRRCTAMYLELTEVNQNLAGIIAPLLLGAAAAGYLSSSGAGITGVSALFGRIRDAFGAEAGGGGATTSTATATATSAGAAAGGAAVTGGAVAAGGVVAAGVAAVATAALVLGGGSGGKDTIVDAQKPNVVQTPTADARESSPDSRVGSAREGSEGSTGNGAGEPGGDVVVVAEIEPATGTDEGDATAGESDGSTSDSGTSDSSSGTAGDGGQGDGSAPAPGDGGDPAPAPDPGDGPVPGPDPGPLVPPIDLPDPLPDTPPVPPDNLPGSPVDTPEVPGTDLPGADPVPGAPTAPTPGDGPETAPDGGTEAPTDGGTTPTDGGDTPTEGDTGDPGTGTDPGQGGSGDPTGGDTDPDTGSEPGTGTDPGSGTDPSDGGSDTEPGDGTDPGTGDTGTGDTGTGDTGETGGSQVPTVTAELTGVNARTKLLTVTVTGAPTGQIVFELVSTDGAPIPSVRFTSAPTTCTFDAGTATCDVADPADAEDLSLAFGVDVPPGQVDNTRLRITFKDADDAPLPGWNPDALPWPLSEAAPGR